MSIGSAAAACVLLADGTRATMLAALGASTSREILLARARTVWPVNSQAAGMFAFSPSAFRTPEQTAPVCSDVPPACIQSQLNQRVHRIMAAARRSDDNCTRRHTATHREAHTSNQLASTDTCSSAGSPRTWRQAATTASSTGFDGATNSTVDVNWWRGRPLRSTCRHGFSQRYERHVHHMCFNENTRLASCQLSQQTWHVHLAVGQPRQLRQPHHS